MSDVPRHHITIDGIRLAYENYGEGQPVVFIHGFPASSYSWRQVAQALSDTHRCICFDLMGFGYSDKPRHADYSLDRQAELIVGAIRQMGLSGITLVGHSIGGGISLSMMRELGPRQDLVSRLVLVNSVCYAQRLPWFMLALTVPWLPRLLMRLIPERWGFRALEGWMYHRDNGMSPDAMAEYVDRLQSPGAHEAMIATVKSIWPKDIDGLVASYGSISVPTLIIWGMQDRVIPLAFGERLSRDITSSNLLKIDTCAHCPQEEKPEEVTQALRKFIEIT